MTKLSKISIRVSEAPEPLDIIWENLTAKEDSKKWIRRLSFILTIILLAVCTYLIY